MLKSLSNKALFTVVKYSLVLFSLIFLFIQLREKSINWNEISEAVYYRINFFWIFILFTLTFLNRFLEIVKWKVLASTLSKINLIAATEQVLSALTIGVLTPLGIGEYAAKTLYTPKKDAKKIIFLNLLCNGIQLLITLTLGMLAFLVLGHFFWFGIYSGIIIVILILSYFSNKIKFKGFSFQKIIQKSKQISNNTYKIVFLAGLGRYLAFSHQFILLLYLFGAPMQYWHTLALIGAFYLISSTLPTFQILDFAVKGSVAVLLFSTIGVNEWILISITTIMWILNVIIPVSIGGFYVLKFNYKWKYS